MQEKIGFILEGGFTCTACLSRDEVLLWHLQIET